MLVRLITIVSIVIATAVILALSKLTPMPQLQSRYLMPVQVWYERHTMNIIILKINVYLNG